MASDSDDPWVSSLTRFGAAFRRDVWTTCNKASFAAWANLSVRLTIFDYVFGLSSSLRDNDGVLIPNRCLVCVDHWRSAAKICNECGANSIWDQRMQLWKEYLGRVLHNVKYKWQWPNLSQITDLDVRCGALRAFLLKQNCFLPSQVCEQVYKRLTDGLPHLFQQIEEAQRSKFKNILFTVLCCFHDETARDTVGLWDIIDQHRRTCGITHPILDVEEDAAVQLHKKAEIASRTVSRHTDFDIPDFVNFLTKGPKNISPEFTSHFS